LKFFQGLVPIFKRRLQKQGRKGLWTQICEAVVDLELSEDEARKLKRLSEDAFNVAIEQTPSFPD
jgi:hypothetical protein